MWHLTKHVPVSVSFQRAVPLSVNAIWPMPVLLEDRHAMQQCHRGVQMSKGIRQQCKKETTKKQSSMHLNTSCSWDFKSWTHQLGTLNFEALHACPPQLPSTWILIVPFGSNEMALLIVNVFGRRFASFCEGKRRIFLHVWRPKGSKVWTLKLS